MASFEEVREVPASLADTWSAYFLPSRWPAWVDSFGSVVAVENDYPREGGVLKWRSVRAGRGEVTERVEAHELRRLHRVAFADPTLTGKMETRFQIKGEGTEVTIEVEYKLVDPSPIARVASLLFVKAQMRGTVKRSLDNFGAELAG